MEDSAFLFPGQGAQTVGMAAALIAESEPARRLFDRAREILGYDIGEICARGPEEELHTTRLSQPAIYLASLAAVEAIEEKLGRPPRACGTAGWSRCW